MVAYINAQKPQGDRKVDRLKSDPQLMNMIKVVYDQLMDAMYGREEAKWTEEKKANIAKFRSGDLDLKDLLEEKKDGKRDI